MWLLGGERVAAGVGRTRNVASGSSAARLAWCPCRLRLHPPPTLCSLPIPTSVALTATLYNLDVQLSDVDRNVYETLSLRVACHPSETAEYLMTRVLAYCLEYTEGLAFSKGLAEPDEPALAVRDLTGALRAWIEVGAPDAARLHRASKASPRVAVYTHRDPRLLLRGYVGERIHRVDDLELYAIDRDLIAALAARLERRTALQVAVTDRHLYVTVGGETLDGAVERHAVGG